MPGSAAAGFLAFAGKTGGKIRLRKKCGANNSFRRFGLLDTIQRRTQIKVLLQRLFLQRRQ